MDPRRCPYKPFVNRICRASPLTSLLLLPGTSVSKGCSLLGKAWAQEWSTSVNWSHGWSLLYGFSPAAWGQSQFQHGDAFLQWGRPKLLLKNSWSPSMHHTMALRPDASGLPFFAQKGLPFFKQKGTLSVPTFLSPHVSQFPRFHMSGQTTWQITYESLLGKMLRLRNSCLWICSVTNKQTWGTPDSDYISNSQERKSHTENKRKKK